MQSCTEPFPEEETARSRMKICFNHGSILSRVSAVSSEFVTSKSSRLSWNSSMKGSSREFPGEKTASGTSVHSASVPLHRPSKRKTNSLEGFNINRLHFSKLGLYGRDKGVAILKDVFNQVHTKSSKESKPESSRMLQDNKQLVLLSGYSGTGKSRLARTLQKICDADKQNTSKRLYVEGKFDFNLQSCEPYSAIAAACGSLCTEILSLQSSDQARSARFRRDQRHLDWNCSYLFESFPSWKKFFHRQMSNSQRIIKVRWTPSTAWSMRFVDSSVL